MTMTPLQRTKAKYGGSAAYRNKWRDSSPEEKKKYLARKTVENHIKAGKLVRGKCERCGSHNVQAHHEDYDKPLEVMWLCPKDHKARHRELKEKSPT